MNNRSFIGFYAILIAFLFIGCKSEKSGIPNIIIIFIDDMGYADVGCFGATDYQTPNIDRLAGEGMILQIFMPRRLFAVLQGHHCLQGVMPSGWVFQAH